MTKAIFLLNDKIWWWMHTLFCVRTRHVISFSVGTRNKQKLFLCFSKHSRKLGTEPSFWWKKDKEVCLTLRRIRESRKFFMITLLSVFLVAHFSELYAMVVTFWRDTSHFFLDKRKKTIIRVVAWFSEFYSMSLCTFVARWCKINAIIVSCQFVNTKFFQLSNEHCLHCLILDVYFNGNREQTETEALK